jgi:type II secretory pathway pseudopilin PulG
MRFFHPGSSAATRNRGGFTLLEILIIALVIALLSGIAVINVQQFVDSNKRKATIADARQLSQALSFAHNDIGFFPKLCFLDDSRVSPKLAQIDAANGAVISFHNDFQIYGSNYQGLDPAPRQWKGPYMGVSLSRSGAAQVRGSGLSLMRLRQDTNVPEGNVQIWPSDTWGSPYLLYAMKWKFDPAQGRYIRRFIGVDNLNNFSERPDATLAVVSYGPNRVPGIIEDERYNEAGPIATRKMWRLFREVLPLGPPGSPDYELVPPDELAMNPEYADVFDIDVDATGPAISGVGSDDIVLEF